MEHIEEEIVNKLKNAAHHDAFLDGTRVYLSGPMDFVASREDEMKNGWRTRIGQFLKKYNVTVYDPWHKPDVAGLPHYGKEDEFSTKGRYDWTYEDSEHGDEVRAKLCNTFESTKHIDLRMTDAADFLISHVPTNIYSVGTVHEIVKARQEHKPVLFVSPSIEFDDLTALEKHLKENGDQEGVSLLEKLKVSAPLKGNQQAIPSMWYMALVDGNYFFDGFGFEQYRKEFGWKKGALDERELASPPKRPLLPYLEKLNKEIPKRFDIEKNTYVDNPDWLLFKKI